MALGLVVGLNLARAQNICIEYGPFYTAWECAVSGSNTSSGSLSFTNLTVCVGDAVTAPTLATAPTFSNGQMRRYVSYNCYGYQNHWETNTLCYVAGSLYFSNSIPSSFTNACTNTYTAKVDATLPAGCVCSNVTATVGQVTIRAIATSVDSDADGLPDCWELHYFGSLSQTASGEPDGDGLTNLEEYLLGRNPTIYDSLNGLSAGTPLLVFTPLE
jgi:hypothetical protein